MLIGMVGAGRMGAGLSRRLAAAGHRCVVHDPDPLARRRARRPGVATVASLPLLVRRLPAPRTVWVMVPADVTGTVLEELATHLDPGDVVIDGGNSHWRDAGPRAASLASRGIGFLDVGTSGGVHGARRGYCLMIGGDAALVRRLEPIFTALAPGVDAAPRTPTPGGRRRAAVAPAPAEQGWLHCGPTGAGHFVKMVHNGIEYGLMAAYAEGFALLTAGADGAGLGIEPAAVAELWRRGSVVSSWLLDLAAAALAADPGLDAFGGRVGDSGEGRWTVETAVQLGVPAHVLSAALFDRYQSRGAGEPAARLLSALRAGFGGHVEPGPASGSGAPAAGEGQPA